MLLLPRALAVQRREGLRSESEFDGGWWCPYEEDLGRGE
jgi:hypothetical protein